MSMNLHLSATIEAISKLGKHEIVECFSLWLLQAKASLWPFMLKLRFGLSCLSFALAFHA